MATTRKRAQPSEPTQGVTVDSLAEFIGDQQPDRDRLEQALTIAKDAAFNFTGIAVGDTAPHPIRQGILMLAAKLLITNQLEESPATDTIPLVVRYFWRAAGAGRQSV
jgi:hypothetical protein